ncbi:nitrilase-related carbon-nitrogen hydrolase [Candidatus Harpocratesius sp.]
MIDFLVPILQAAAILGYVILKFVPFLVFSTITKKIPSIMKSFLFASLFSIFEFISSLVTPFGTWSSIAYSQFDWKISMQIISLTGLWGLVFSIAFVNGIFSEILVYMINNAEFHKIPTYKLKLMKMLKSKQVKVLAICIFSIFGFGLVRLSIPHHATTTVRVMTIIDDERASRSLDDFENIFQTYCPLYKPDIVSNNEYGFYFDITEKNDVFSRFENACQTYNFDLCIAGKEYGSSSSKNQLWWFSSEGNLVAEYNKHNLISGIETTAYFEHQSGYPPEIEVDSIQVSTYICFDGVFNSFVNLRVPNSVDLVIQPSFDWEQIDPSHSKLATFRAVENGYALIKPTFQGKTIACDAFGREIFPSNISRLGTTTISVYDIPIFRNIAVYKWTSEYFIGLCIIGSLYVIVKQYQRN